MVDRPFPLQQTPIHVPDEQLADLSARLKATRWPPDSGNDDWYYGVSKPYLKELADYWIDGFDWRKAEAAINAYEQYQTQVDGVPVHLMRKAGVGPRPVPLILSHGWPWTFWHWSKVIDALADPAAFGGDPADAFDVIVPSLPGFGFSSPLPEHPDMNFWKIADLWHTLMTGTLGYRKYAAGGSDMGALVTSQLGHKYADELYALHLGSAIPMDIFTGDRAWDLTAGRTIPDDVPDHVPGRDRVLPAPVRRPRRRARPRLVHRFLRPVRLTRRHAGLDPRAMGRLERQSRRRRERLQQG